MSCEIKKEQFPENVWFNFHSYCAGCNEFEPDVEKVWVDGFDRSCKVYTIYCKHAGACARAYKVGGNEEERRTPDTPTIIEADRAESEGE